ncbi:hypothetical protein GGI09_002408 [Coemansia sp. S100]|nr:hypothetical protein LPJ71_001263 [Coemansia sp. S17]KAJ2100169.1 hypothetical protein GGI09_002408 [Coemansia sp. S100]KAJ2109667.1 hypothetical protein GGI16_000633 [Coemansia sp. S142-1]
MDKPTRNQGDEPTRNQGDEPSASAIWQLDGANHLAGPIVLSRAEIFAKQLELNAKRLGFNAKQLDLDDKQLELDEQQRKLDDEQRELNGQSSVSVVFGLMASASARTTARTTAIPVVNAPTDDPTNPTTEQLLAPITATPAESISPCLPIAAMPRLLVAALPAARPTAAQEGKRPAPINELTESPIAPKRHRGDGQITNNGSATGLSRTTCRSLSEQVAVERLIAALDIPALVAPATGAPTFGNAHAAGALNLDISALVAPAANAPALVAPTAGASTFSSAHAASVLDLDISALFSPAADISAFAPAAGALAADYSAFAAPAAGALAADISVFAPAAGALAADYSAFAAPAAGILDRDFSALVAPAAGATTFGNAPAVGVLDRNISALVAPAAGTTMFGNAPAVGVSDLNISDLFAPATSTTTFGNAPAIGVSAFGAPAAGATTFSDALAIGTPTFDDAPAIGISAFGIAPALSISDLDISALVAPAVGTTTFGVTPAIGVSDLDISDLFAPATSATTFGNAPAIGVSAFGAPAAGAPTLGDALAIGARTFGDAPAVGVSAFGVAPTVDVPTVDMRVSDSVTAAELLRMIYDVSGMVFDVSGEQVTSERLLVVLGEAPYVSLGYVLDAYRHIYGCALMPRTTSSQYRITTLARVVALEHWAPQLDEEDPAHVADLNILCRRDLEIGALRQNYREQLGLANDPNAAVLGPRLCYVIVKMCSMSVDLLTGPVLRSMFLGATGLDLHSLNVVTEKGVLRMEAESICHTVESWVGNIIKFIADDGNGLDGALSMATDCNALFETRRGSAASDSTEVAMGMLMNNVLYSTLFLGNGEAKWEALFRCLTFVTGKNTSSYAKECLVQLSKSLQVQPSS